MKYKLVKNYFMGEEYLSIITTKDNFNFISFPVWLGNPNYDAFLEQAKLTDKKVKALKVDTWFDFPEEVE
jgi:hypothetical protein